MATTTKVFNIAGGKHSAEAYSSFEGLLYGSCVASGLTISKSSSNMNCFINSGAGLIKVGTTYARRFAIEGGTLTVTVSAASSTLARRDTIVLYVDNSVTPTTSVEDNTNNILKGMVVAGTPAQNPTAPNATAIQSAVGAGNPYIILYDIVVPANATNLSTATLYDRRVMASKALVDALPSGAIPTAAIADSAVTADKINWPSMNYASVTSASTQAATTTATTYITLNVASFPAGSKLLVGVDVRFTGSDTLTGKLVTFAGETYQEVTQWGASVTFTKIIDKPANGILEAKIAKDNASNVSATGGNCWAVRVA